ncbi:hypothetical protein D3C76_1502420 [compost metagenome]
MPADTFRHNTSQIRANCGVFQATLTCTWRSVTMVLPAFFTGAVQPSGFQPVGGTRYARAPAVMNTK